jgi:acetyl-CoA acyltransferase
MAGAYDAVVAAGVESMSRVPMGVTAMQGPGVPFGPAFMQKYEELNLYGKGGLVSQGISAEIVAEKWKLTRRELDEFALESHKRAATATARGYFKNEIVPLTTMHGDGGVGTDEGIRADATMERLASLPPAFDQNGVVTAGNSSQITDGAAAVLIMEKRKALDLGLRPRARVHCIRTGRGRSGHHADRDHSGHTENPSENRVAPR